MNTPRGAWAPLLASLLALAACSAPEHAPRPAPGTPESVAPTAASKTIKSRHAAGAADTATTSSSTTAPRPTGRLDHAASVQTMPAREVPAARGIAPVPKITYERQERERYGKLDENPVKLTAEQSVSTFSIDVDTGAYANVRRFLNQGRLPPHDAVRVEELVNYFPYDYAQPQGSAPFAVHTEVARAPWNENNLLLRIAIKGLDIAKQSLPPANLVFLVDVSGSMQPEPRLPLAKQALRLLVNELRAQDRVSLVTYANGTQVVLEPTSGADKTTILAAIERLHAGGATAGASGIQLAYAMAAKSFITGGINRILLATDGDFNVGITSFDALKQMVAEKRKTGISLSTLGYGEGNYNEQLMEQLADAGDGAYSYIDTLMEGRKVLINELTSTLATIARDVKIQVEFHPTAVREYRLIGYENRQLHREDFNNDNVDAGDIGAGHTVTALYEITPVGVTGLVDDLRYRRQAPSAASNELAHLKLRYKLPNADKSTLMQFSIAADSTTSAQPIARAGVEFRFAVAVAGFGQLLRGAKHTGDWSFDDARTLAAASRGNDRFGYRAEFLRLIDVAQSLSRNTQASVAVSQ